MLTKGHTLSKGKRRPGGGRKKSIPRTIKDIMDKDWLNLPSYLQKLGELARNGDKEALIYLINRHMGTPKQTIDQRSLLITLDADTLYKATKSQIDQYLSKYPDITLLQESDTIEKGEKEVHNGQKGASEVTDAEDA